MDGQQLVKTKRVLEELAAVGELRGDYVLALQAVGELMGIMVRHNQHAAGCQAADDDIPDAGGISTIAPG